MKGSVWVDSFTGSGRVRWVWCIVFVFFFRPLCTIPICCCFCFCVRQIRMPALAQYCHPLTAEDLHVRKVGEGEYVQSSIDVVGHVKCAPCCAFRRSRSPPCPALTWFRCNMQVRRASATRLLPSRLHDGALQLLLLGRDYLQGPYVQGELRPGARMRRPGNKPV